MIPELDAYRAAVDRELARLAATADGTDPVSAAVRYAVGTGGKRLRPVLCLAAMAAVRPDNDPLAQPDAVRAACAVELVHTYSLVHDDLPCMDDDDLRRGRATTHRVYGSSAALLAGFALIPLACRTLAAAAAALRPHSTAAQDAVRELCAGAGAAGMVAGQVLDLDAEGARVPLDGLSRIHALKTGALFRSALRIGGLMTGADRAQLAALGMFGDHLGMAFQIVDDVLDETAATAALGKTSGKDRAAEKSTFVSLLGVEEARVRARDEADLAVGALAGAGLHSAALSALAGFAVDRDR